ncbi:MAG: alpha/beta fold hydrolase [Hyphomicrobiaceae bacterium]
MIDFFPGYARHRIPLGDVEIFARSGGTGSPLLLLHGYPQTHVAWHRIAPALARQFNVVVADLRGYGASSCPPGDGGARAYTKRVMAEDMIALMRALGHDRFSIAGHDRGARVAYRMALDHPAVVDRLVLLDVLTTFDNWERMRWRGALFSYHWTFLAQPYPLPETLIAADPGYYVAHTLQSWTGDKTLGCFDPAALEAYKASLATPERIHAVCEDYRAGATVDRDLDAADREAGRRISRPTQLIWGQRYLSRGGDDPLQYWRQWCPDITGAAVDSGHFQAEERPAETLAAMIPFLSAST